MIKDDIGKIIDLIAKGIGFSFYFAFLLAWGSLALCVLIVLLYHLVKFIGFNI